MNHKIVTKCHRQSEFSARSCVYPPVLGTVHQTDPGAGEDLEISQICCGGEGSDEKDKGKSGQTREQVSEP